MSTIKTKKTIIPSAQKSKTIENKPADFAFYRENYRLMIIGLVLIFLGFLLMIGGGSNDPHVFSYKMFSFRRITLSPLLILLGYVIEIFAILRKPKS